MKQIFRVAVTLISSALICLLSLQILFAATLDVDTLLTTETVDLLVMCRKDK